MPGIPNFERTTHFIAFLELDGDLPKATSTSTLSSAGIARLFGRVGDSINKMTFTMSEPDQVLFLVFVNTLLEIIVIDYCTQFYLKQNICFLVALSIFSNMESYLLRAISYIFGISLHFASLIIVNEADVSCQKI